MYIHRVAIDANMLNARQTIPAMNELERLHDAHLIEIVQTSTMNADLRKAHQLQRGKAAKYGTIYSAGSWLLEKGSPLADSETGPVLRNGRMFEIYENVFGPDANGKRRGPHWKEHHLNSLRDALHLDQCWANMVDYFVTDEKRLRSCDIVDFKICDAEQCLEEILTYFENTRNTRDTSELAAALSACGPMILGSNAAYFFQVPDPRCGEPFLTVDASPDDGFSISALLKGLDGNDQVRVSPLKNCILSEDSYISMIDGPFPLRLGPDRCKSFAICSSDETLLAGRLVAPGRLVLFEAHIRSSDGPEVLTIRRQNLEFSRVLPSFRPPS